VTRPGTLFALVGGLLLLSAQSGGVVAQQPTQTTARYGAWVVQCNTVKDAKVCEMVQTLAQKDRRVVAQVAIGRLPTSDTLRAVLQVPTGVDLTKPASFSLSDSDKDKFVGRYVACTPRFCRSEIDLPASLTKLPANLDKAAIHFHIPGKMVVVPMQSDGMVAAFDAVFKKAKG
jgi:invasion protein IalB